MVTLDMLWLPIIVSSVIVFIASSIIHMAPLWHKNDYPKFEKQDEVMDALRPLNIPPGEYMIPRADSNKEMNSPEFIEKAKKGPVMILTAWKYGEPSMGVTLFYWFLYTALIGIFAAYVAGRALPAGSHYLEVFRFAGVTAFLGYAAALLQNSIWYRKPWRPTLVNILDGFIYALLTAGTFGWLWPV